MEETAKTLITVKTIVNAPVEKVWVYWSEPAHITQWNQASDDWHSPYAENDLRIGGTFKTTMAAKDGSFSFDFGGTYTEVQPFKKIVYELGDGRMVDITFTDLGGATEVLEIFEAETTNSIEMQQGGWQAILNSFKKYTEEN